MNYASLLNTYIEKSGLTLDQIADKCKVKGIKIHPTYISKLRKGLRPSPTEDISRVLAEVCEQDADKLIFLGYLGKTPSPIVEKFLEYEGLFSFVKQSLLQLCNDDDFMDKLSQKLGYKISFEQLCDLFQNLSIADQLSFIASSDLSIHVKENKDNEIDVSFELNDSSATKGNQNSNTKDPIANILKLPLRNHPLVPKDAIPLFDQIIKLPVYGEVRAGVGGYAVQEYLGTQEWLAKNGNCKDCYMLQIKGDSMTPRFLPGDFAVVRPQNDVDNGEIAIVIVDNEEGVIKRIKKYPDGMGIALKSDNSLYEDREFYGDDREHVKIIGKVVDIKAGRL